jgi:hypothetical protein
MHECRKLSAKPIHPPIDERQECVFLCSRCGACYVCKHKAIYFEVEDVWKWKCRDGKIREVILDGRLKEGQTHKS